MFGGAIMKPTTFGPPGSHLWRFSRNFLLDLAIAVGIGLAVTLLEGVGSTEFFPASVFLRNVIITACAVFAWRMTDMVLTLKRDDHPLPFRYGVFGIAVWLGYLIGVAITGPIFGFQQNFPMDINVRYPWLLATLTLVALVAALLLYHVRATNRELEAQIDDRFQIREGEIARRVERELNPPSEVALEDLTITARNQSAHLARTDFYDVRTLKTGEVVVALADVRGERVSASQIRSSCNALMPFLSAQEPEAVMSALNSKLCSELPRGASVAMLYARCDPKTGRLSVVNAGMPDPIHVHAGRKAEEHAPEGDSLPLGVRRDCQYKAMQLQLEPGERMLLFSNGLPDVSVGTQTIGSPTVVEYARRTSTIDGLLEQIETIPGLTVTDDVTVVQLERASRAA